MATQPPGGPKDETRAQLMQMRNDIDRVVATVHQLVSAQAVENVLMNGFSELSAELHQHLRPLADLPAKLQPLAALAPPQRPHMLEPERIRLQEVRASLAREAWIGPGTAAVKRPPEPDTDDVSLLYQMD